MKLERGFSDWEKQRIHLESSASTWMLAVVPQIVGSRRLDSFGRPTVSRQVCTIAMVLSRWRDRHWCRWSQYANGLT